ncbi:sigma factor-like helix-turn-helix DNA-binding protein [Goekera deserti]|uniref:RNA polymerase sigma factor 70 region 4 type 2 domain-containing protein n=1 Tax=Goekera deserti TaxID=2497753 RepID=A0A7K3WE92_9ACTN|nr:sigma factor-like helix-turn-helix DNA-binding protein [Goekera deserti]NDI48261.1 hypothetical protein [Goekera deserti]NEL54010.1 hypothetical protein [Goekera deserti]
MRDTGGFSGFAADQRPALLVTAHLLTGADRPAADLVRRGLLRAWPAWRRLPPDAGAGEQRALALRGLARAHLAPTRRWLRGDGVLTEDGGGRAPGAWWTSPADAEAARRLGAALDTLEPAERAAVVLRAHEGLPVPAVAALLGRPAAEVRTLVGAALARLAPEVAAADLPSRLDGLAAQSDARTLDDVPDGATLVRQQRGRRLRLSAGVTAVLALLVLLPSVAGRTASAPAPAPAAAPVDGGSTPAGATWQRPTAGSLADDPRFLDGVQRLAWPMAPPSSGSRQVAFAGDVLGSRWALVLGRTSGVLRGQWYVGPAGTDPAGLRAEGTIEVSEGGTAAHLSRSAGGPVLLVLTEREAEVEYSPGVEVRADGTADPRWTPVPDAGGIAAVRLDDASAPVRYRVLAAGAVQETGRPATGSERPVPEPSTPPPALRPGPGDVGPLPWTLALDTLTSATGLTAADLDPVVLWLGRITGPAGSTAEATVLAAVVPSGAVVTTTAYALPRATTPGGTGGSCGSQAHPAGTDPTSLTVVARCQVSDGRGRQVPSVLVTAPPGVTAVRMGFNPEAPVLDQPLQDGFANLGGVSVTFTHFTRDGEPGDISHTGPGDLFPS